MSPDYLSEDFKLYEPTSKASLREGVGRDRLMLKLPPIKQQNKSIFSKLILNWNSIPYNIRMIKSQPLFKQNLKTYLYKQAYSKFA